MTRPDALPQRMRGSRLVALLLTLLLAVGSLAGHASMESCTTDCATMQSEWHDADEADCHACSALSGVSRLAAPGPQALAIASAIAMTDHIPLPPRRPPRS